MMLDFRKSEGVDRIVYSSTVTRWFMNRKIQMITTIQDSRNQMIYGYIVTRRFMTRETRWFTVIRFVSTSAKFGICIVVSVNGTLVENKLLRFKCECAHFSFNKCLIYTHDGASAKCSANSHETNNSVYD